MRRLALTLLTLVAIAACNPGGSYGPSARAAGQADRGETNGRTFDFVSNMPDSDDWQLRIRDSSLWGAYGSGTKVTELGTARLDDKETARVWQLIDNLDLGGREEGTKDEDEGYVQLRLREPGGDAGHDFITVYVTRATEDEAVLEVATYLQRLILKYFKKEADF